MLWSAASIGRDVPDRLESKLLLAWYRPHVFLIEAACTEEGWETCIIGRLFVNEPVIFSRQFGPFVYAVYLALKMEICFEQATAWRS
jgi:hypothetical protein